MSQRRFAAFDIDGTVFRWQLYHQLFDECQARNLSDDTTSRLVHEAKRAWQDRLITFPEYEAVLIEVLEKLVVRLDSEDLQTMAETIISEHGRRTYLYTTQLIKDLKEQGYVIVAISGSHHELVEAFAQLHQIDIFEGRRFVKKDGQLVSAGSVVHRKGELLKNLVAQHDLSWEGSYAVGDSASDIAMLKLVENPIAFNPNPELLERARDAHWPIVVERKSIAYEMRYRDGGYVLA